MWLITFALAEKISTPVVTFLPRTALTMANTNWSDVEDALKKAFVDHKDDLVFIDFITDQKANVFPMVAAGKGLADMLLTEDL